MKWRDMAEVSRELHPESRPQVGSCYVSEDRRFTVALVNTADPSKGWAVWFVGGPTMRLFESLPITSAMQGQVLASLVARVVRGVGFVLRARSVLKALLAAASDKPHVARHFAEESVFRRRPGPGASDSSVKGRN